MGSKQVGWTHIGLAVMGSVMAVSVGTASAIAQPDPLAPLPVPPPDDIPEEILRTEVIFEARSPLDGSPMAAAAYAQLQQDLAASQTTLTLNNDIRRILFLLQTRRALKPLIPFLP